MPNTNNARNDRSRLLPWVAAVTILVASCSAEQIENPRTRKKIQIGQSSGGADAPATASTLPKRNPKITVVQPAASLLAVRDIVEIEVVIAEGKADATWSAYYSNKKDANTGGTRIVENKPVGELKHNWDTKGFADGGYYIYVNLLEDGVVVSTAFAPVVVIDRINGQNLPPEFTANNLPAANSFALTTTPREITWTVDEPDGDTMTYAVEYSADAGATWTMVAQNLTATTYSWNTTNLAPDRDYRLRITANDGKGGVAVAVSPGTFCMGPTAPPAAGIIRNLVATSCAGAQCHAAALRPLSVDAAPMAALGPARIVERAAVLDTMPIAGPLPAARQNELLAWRDAMYCQP